MKITAKQLARLVSEEAKKYVSEPTPDEQGSNEKPSEQQLEDSLQAFADAWASFQLESVERDDPSIEGSGGWEAWEAQVEEATEALIDRISRVIEEVDQDLHNGSFFHENR